MKLNWDPIPNFLPIDEIKGCVWGKEFALTDIYQKAEIIVVQPFNLLMKHNFMPHSIDDLDLFTEIEFSNEQMRVLEKPNGFLFFNLSMEGFSHTENNFFNMLTNSALKHNIPTEKMFFLSGNLLDEENYKVWQQEHSPNHKINVFSNSYEYFYPDCKDKSIFVPIDQTVKHIRENDVKNFLCLNRVIRPMRVALVYKIISSTFREDTLLSYAHYTKEEVFSYIKMLEKDKWIIPVPRIVEELSSGPSVLDHDDFENNFAFYDYPFKLYQQSLISIVNETQHDDWNDTSLFYSEKTFKPMISNHPVFIVGQKNLNKGLERIGYKTYHNYFNFDFDSIPDHWQRLTAQISQLEELNQKLKNMSVNQKIDWLLQDVDTLEHNKQSLHEHIFAHRFMDKLSKRLEELIQ